MNREQNSRKNKLVAKRMLTPSRMREQLSMISQILVYEKLIICISSFAFENLFIVTPWICDSDLSNGLCFIIYTDFGVGDDSSKHS